MTVIIPAVLPAGNPAVREPIGDLYGFDLLGLARTRLEALLFNPDSETVSTLDSVMKRLFDPRERDLLTVSAFSSAL